MEGSYNVPPDHLERIVLRDCMTVHTNAILWSEVGKTRGVSIRIPLTMPAIQKPSSWTFQVTDTLW